MTKASEATPKPRRLRSALQVHVLLGAPAVMPQATQQHCSMTGAKEGSASSWADDSHLPPVQRLPCPGSLFSAAEVDKGVHAPREGDHILHCPILLKDNLQHAASQPCV